MRSEARFALRSLAAIVVLAALWPAFSGAYERILKLIAPAAAELIGRALAAGPAGASAWLLPAIALMLAADTGWRRRSLAVLAIVAVSIALDVVVLLATAAAGATLEQSVAAYRSAQAILPFAAILVFTSGRPAMLWGGGGR